MCYEFSQAPKEAGKNPAQNEEQTLLDGMGSLLLLSQEAYTRHKDHRPQSTDKQRWYASLQESLYRVQEVQQEEE